MDWWGGRVEITVLAVTGLADVYMKQRVPKKAVEGLGST